MVDHARIPLARRTRDLGSAGVERLTALATAGGFSPTDIAAMSATFVDMLGDHAERPLGLAPAYASDVVDDHTPFEFSVALGEAPQLRFLVEPVERDTSLAGRWRAARAAGTRLQRQVGATLERLDRIADLFEPRGETGLLALWYALAFTPGAAPDVKAYFDLRARGADRSRAVLEEALARLDLAAAYPQVMARAAGRGPTCDELVYFSLDLTADDAARVKVYVRHHDATAADVAAVLGTIGGDARDDVDAFCTAILGHAGPYPARPLVTCWSFSRGPEPTGATLYAPIAYYVKHDAEAAARIRASLASQPASCAQYERYLTAFARRRLDDGVGMHSYVSFKRAARRVKTTIYLAPEVYETFPPGALEHRRTPPPARPHEPEQLVRHLETIERIADHPLFERLRREAPVIAPLWTLLANNWVGIGENFPSWLEALIARVDDAAIRSVLAKQLDDELGAGDPAKAHRVLFQRMLADLEPHAPRGDRDALLAPGRRLAERLALHYLERPVYEAIGGTIVMEVFGKQVDQRIGELLRRSDAVDVSRLTWLVLHESLEVEHADESIVLARMASSGRGQRIATRRGAEALVELGYAYLDDVYAAVFR